MFSSNDNHKFILAGICSTLIAIGLGRFIYTPILPDMQDSLSLSSTTMGVLSSSNYLGYLVGSIFPIIIKLNNLKLVIILSSIITSSTIFLMGLTSNITLFIFLRFICGISSALGFIFTISLMFSAFKEAQNTSLQLLHFCGIGLGIAIGTSIIWIISNIGFNWIAQWKIMGVLGIILCLPIVKYTNIKIEKTNNIEHQIKNEFKLNFVTISLGYFFFGIGYIIFGTFISALVKNSSELGHYQYLSWIVVGIFAIPSVIFWNKISKIMCSDFLLFFSCSTVTFGILFLLIGNNSYFLFVACAFYGLGVPGSVAFILVEGKKRFVGNINMSVAILTTTFSFGQILGPYVSGLLIDLGNNYHSSIFLAMICLILSSILMLEPRRIKKKIK